MTPEAIQNLIQQHLTDAKIEVLSDDNVHFSATVVSEQFAGKRPVARHQMIYKALGEHMRADIHALSIMALTPEEQAGQGN
ncbi:MAG: BolA/IbaG family iron-sulfur metabolism protein [Pseudomonadota bacterium]